MSRQGFGRFTFPLEKPIVIVDGLILAMNHFLKNLRRPRHAPKYQLSIGTKTVKIGQVFGSASVPRC